MSEYEYNIPNNTSNASKLHYSHQNQPVKTRVRNDSIISFNNRCGLLSWRPNCLQKFRSIYLFLLTMCIVCILQTALSAGYMSSQITTLERRFSLDSYMLGVIQSFFDVGFILSVVFVGYFGGQGRIPLWVGCGMLIMSVGAFSFAIPEFITTFETSISDGNNHIQICQSKNFTSSKRHCDSQNKANWLVKLLFIVGQVLIGCGSSPVLSLGPTYIDDHVLPTFAPPLIAMLYASSALGPVLGFGLGATMLQYPVSNKIVKGSRPGDSNWIGAWWGGYAFLGICCVVVALFLFMFPKKVRKVKTANPFISIGLKTNKDAGSPTVDDQQAAKKQIANGPQSDYQIQVRESLVNNIHNDQNMLGSQKIEITKNAHSSDVSRQLSNASIAKEYGKNLRDLPGAVLSLLKNKVFIIVSLAICFEMFLVNGFAAFLPKYIENEYKVSNITSSLIAGGLIVPAGALGIITGGVLMHRFQMSRRRAILFSIGGVLAVLVCLVLFFITGCQNPSFAGINTPIVYGSENQTSISNTCTMNQCTNLCNPNIFSPVCDSASGVTFFSPCHAGCKSANLGDKKNFYNCSCTSTPLNYLNPPSHLEAGECPLKCNSLITFVLFLTMALFLTGLTQNPLLMVTMRSVQKHERSFALGFQFVILRLLAYIPSPIVYGSVIDAACVHWKQNCAERGDCLVTDLKLLNQYLIGLSFAVKLGAAVFYIILFIILPKHAHITNPESASGTDDQALETGTIDKYGSNTGPTLTLTTEPV